MARRRITPVEAERAFNEGKAVYKGRLKRSPALLRGYTGDTWQDALNTYGGHTRRSWYLDE